MSQDHQYSKWGWAVRDRQKFLLVSKHGMPERFVRAAEQAVMDAVGERTGKWTARVDEKLEPSAGSGAVIALKRAGGETVDVTVRGWRFA